MANYYVPPGQTKTYTLHNGDSEYVSSGGTADDTVVYNGGTLTISSGGHGTGTTLSGGTEVLYGTQSGLHSPVPTSGPGNFELIEGGGIDTDATFDGESAQFVFSGGIAIDTSLSGTPSPFSEAGQNVYSGGVASDTSLLGGAEEGIENGLAINLTAVGSANLIFNSGVLLYSAASAQVKSQITGNGLILTEGNTTRVNFTGTRFFGNPPFEGEALIGPGTEMELGNTSALDSGTITFEPDANATLTIDGNTTPTETITNFTNGDTIDLEGLSISGAQVSDGLVQLFRTDGGEDDIVITDAHPGGIGIFTPGPGMVVLSSYLVPTVITSDGDAITDATLTDYEVGNGYSLYVSSGGTATEGFIGNAALDIVSGGIASGNDITSGGTEDVETAGLADGEVFFYSSTEIVTLSGTSEDPDFKGGTLDDDGMVVFGGSAGSPASAEVDVVSGGGTVQAASGTVQFDGDASNFSGTVMLTGPSTVEISDNASLNSGASIQFDAGSDDPTLQIDPQLNALPRATISGFASALDIIDLRGLSFTPNTTSTPYSSYDTAAIVTSGGSVVLDVTSGGQAYALKLDPNTTAAGPLDLYADGGGGTNVTFSTLSATDANALAADISSAAFLSEGSFTILLTDYIVLNGDNGETMDIGSLQAEDGATVVLDGDGYTLDPGVGAPPNLVASAGPIVVTDLGGSIGLTVAGGSHVTASMNNYSGGTELAAGVLEVADQFGAGDDDITFGLSASGNQTLQVDPAAQPSSGMDFAELIDDFGNAAGQFLDLAGFVFSSGVTAASVTPLGGSGELLNITNGGKAAGFILESGAQAFNTFDDGHGGTLVTADSVACYCADTLILTDCGEIPIQALKVGDHVMTKSGIPKPIQWIGHRSHTGRYPAGKHHLLPVRLRAGSLGDGLPRRDLIVSPEHAMLLDGVLVPARFLLNGNTIVQEGGLDRVDYYHVELDTHDVLFAEGAPSESFVDDDSRGIFHNAAEWDALYPGRERISAVYCAPRVESGFTLEAIRRRLENGVRQAA